MHLNHIWQWFLKCNHSRVAAAACRVVSCMWYFLRSAMCFCMKASSVDSPAANVSYSASDSASTSAADSPSFSTSLAGLNLSSTACCRATYETGRTMTYLWTTGSMAHHANLVNSMHQLQCQIMHLTHLVQCVMKGGCSLVKTGTTKGHHLGIVGRLRRPIFC